MLLPFNMYACVYVTTQSTLNTELTSCTCMNVHLQFGAKCMLATIAKWLIAV